MAIDPLWEEYRHLTPYNYAENNPLRLKDPSGFGSALGVGDMRARHAKEDLGSSGGGGKVQLGARGSSGGNTGSPGVGNEHVDPEKYPMHQQQGYATRSTASTTSKTNSSKNSPAKEKGTNGMQLPEKPGGDKPVPNPWGRPGKPEHQRIVEEMFMDMESRGLTPVREYYIKTPEGTKRGRFVDVAGVDQNGQVTEMYQVGKQNQNGTPVAREARAIQDIQKATGQTPEFIPYNVTTP